MVKTQAKNAWGYQKLSSKETGIDQKIIPCYLPGYSLNDIECHPSGFQSWERTNHCNFKPPSCCSELVSAAPGNNKSSDASVSPSAKWSRN